MSILSDALAALHKPRAPLLHVAVDQGSGPPVILVHGIASSSATFHYVIPLIQAGHRVIAIDILGFGESPQPPDAEYTMYEHVDALAATIHSLHLREPFVLVGHSLGCLITSRFASTHPKVVTHLVLVSPPIYLNPMEIGDPKLRKRVSGYLKIYDYLLQNKDFTVARAAVVSRMLPVQHVLEITEDNWVPFVKSMQHCIEVQTIISDLAHVEVPIDVVYGRFDEFIAPGSIAIIEKMRGVTVHMVQASDHMIRTPLARVAAAAINADPESLAVT
ncbi:alpha/beta fold hydrolase [Subtercola endophyticus]|uniref:alpha/beta fold hydrolase n=1 Tax=Subtercola endophyticus TaxID=2895559 RepID=UPI001E61AAE9|nr:alpha/beta hydrolase [Subtercola endophyticus]UFS60439.1 alpha/beta hydrolase [Subtercola endophyticus]